MKKNRLANESSPYLLQHATNPVDWYPWGEQALARSRRENKPIFLSVGYSACHWCHVMERESFEDEETAKILNQHFISIKVDREERPDIDALYMTAVQAMTQHGGWPMSVFLTPEGKPFYGGTYFPPEDRPGMPSFQKVCLGVANAWQSKREEVLQSSEQFTSALKNLTEGNLEYSAPDLWKSEWLEKAAASFKQGVDWQLGGMGTAPKFFHTMMFRFLLRYAKKNDDQESRKAVTLMLRALAWGGIRDHLGGGFHRYSTDREWLVPHFEKMLYDNALISELYLEAFQATRNSEFATVARETLDYVVNEMTDPGGGFYSTQDADSEGVEGKFYTWSSEEISDALESPWRERFCEYYSVSQSGNWAGTNILHLRQELGSFVKNWDVDVVVAERELALCRRKLLELRQKRVAPLRDEKILVAWNGMMITSFAKAYQVLGDESYLNAAKKAANFVIDKLWEAQERPGLSHSCKDREPKGNGFLDDYTHFMNGLLSLYEADFDQKWIDWAKKLADFVSENFWDEESQSFYYTPKFHEKLIVKTRDIHDGATPSANSMAAHVFHHLGRMTGVDDYRKKAELSVGGLSQFMETQVTAISQLVLTLDDHLSSFREIVVTQGDGREELLGALREMYLPNTLILSTGEGDHLPLLAGKEPDGTNAQVYVCQGQSCSAPVSEVAKLQGLLQ